MKRFIFLTLLFLGWSFWELSGGSDFEPEVRAAVAAEAPTEQPVPAIVTAADVPETQTDESTAAALVAATEAAIAEAAAVSTPVVEPVRVVEQQPVVEQAPAVVEPEPDQTLDIRYVDASRVNMRSGPSTDYRVVDTLGRDTEVIVLEIDRSGGDPWAKLEVTSTGLQGWMAERFLSRQ